MSYFINVSILTMSEKFGKKCVAAYDINNKKLVRLVSDKYGAGIDKWKLSNVSLLDVVCVHVLYDAPLEHQTENIIIDLSYGFKKLNLIMSIEEIYENLPQYPSILEDNNYKLLNPKIDHSLELIKFNDMRLITEEYSKTKASFFHNNCLHRFYSITDKRFFGENENINSGYAVISLPPSSAYTETNGYFKFIAAIYPNKVTDDYDDNDLPF